jgi:hypothetical protein
MSHHGLPAGFDSWKTRSDLDDAPDGDGDFDDCDVCGEVSNDLDWHGQYLACPKCRTAEEDEAADRGDFDCHQERDR